MKKLAFTIMLLTLLTPLAQAGQFTNKLPLPGKTQCDRRLQADVLSTITNFVSYLADNSCTKYQVINTQTIQDFGLYKQEATGITWHPWEEAWTIKACSRTLNVNVGFKHDVYGGTGTSFAVTNAEKLIQEARKQKGQ